MKRFNPALKQDDYGYHYVEMEESSNGKYVLAEDAYEENPNYIWNYRDGDWVQKYNFHNTTEREE